MSYGDKNETTSIHDLKNKKDMYKTEDDNDMNKGNKT